MVVAEEDYVGYLPTWGEVTVTNNLDTGPFCECSRLDQPHPYCVHTDEGCTEYDPYGLPCACTGFTPFRG